MGWTKTTTRTKPHRCRKPRATRHHGHNSQWTCDTCGKKWELHRHQYNPRCTHRTHWNPYGTFCAICGPGVGLIWPKPEKPEPIESPDQPEPIEGGSQ
jgi:hypothetical protein